VTGTRRELRSGHGASPSAYVAAGVAFLGVALACRSPASRRSAVITVQLAQPAGR
jgi:hypothetical protein